MIWKFILNCFCFSLLEYKTIFQFFALWKIYNKNSSANVSISISSGKSVEKTFIKNVRWYEWNRNKSKTNGFFFLFTLIIFYIIFVLPSTVSRNIDDKNNFLENKCCESCLLRKSAVNRKFYVLGEKMMQ